MLVLSRRPQEKFAFPSLGISVEILRVEGKAVRVGIDAPRSLPVVRGELEPRGEAGLPPPLAETRSPRLDHHMRGCLNTATVALYVAQKQIEIGATEAATQTIQEAIDLFASLEEQVSGPVSPARPAEPQRLSALLVEDNVNECALLVSYLRLNSFEVDAVNDGQAALDYLATKGRPDIVLLDMRLPTRSGPEILETLRGDPDHRDLKICAMTGASASEYGIPTGPGGVDRWFTKPLNPPHMIESLKRLVVGS